MAKKSFLGSTGKTGIQENTGMLSLFSDATADQFQKEPEVLKVAPESRQQTFMMNNEYYERLKDYVHLVRKKGDTYYSQKEALQDALDLLFKQVGEIPRRPESVIRREREKGNRISKTKRG